MPKKADGTRLRITISPGAGASTSTIWLSGASSVRPVSAGTFMHMMLVSAAVVGEDHAGVGHGHAALAAEGEQPHRRLDRLVDVAAAELGRVGEAVDEIDDEQRRLLAESEPVPEILCLVDVDVRSHAAPRHVSRLRTDGTPRPVKRPLGNASDHGTVVALDRHFSELAVL